MALHNIKFPRKQTAKTKNGTITLQYSTDFIRNFNDNLNKIQTYLDERVGRNLQEYVSLKDGGQRDSIALAGTYGKGYVIINVEYAHYQAYSKRIKKRAGKRGTQPFERMVSDKKASIQRQVEAYSRRLNG